MAGTTFICKACHKQLPKPKRKRKSVEISSCSTELIFDEEEDEGECLIGDRDIGDLEVDSPGVPQATTSTSLPQNIALTSSEADMIIENAIDFSGVPKESLLFGLWPGPIPVELTGLTLVEVSMISMYSPITKISLQGGKHFRTKGATSFTVINDVTKIYKQLPVMPTPESTGILRAQNTRCTKDYTYRPDKVKKALLWLRKNNHLYAELPELFIYP